ncbi:MAG: hypothetical protein QUS33_04780 [Dehalococcoidia bacterium]|nr:hypothetical protein [Dehalococcoidia bacterium]
MRRKDITPEQRIRVLDLLRVGTKPKAVADKVGLSVSSVYSIQRKAAAQTIVSELALQKLSQHWDRLAALAQDIASRLQAPELRSLWLTGDRCHLPNNLDGIQSLHFLNGDSDQPLQPAWKEDANGLDYRLYPHLHTHLKAEDADWGRKMANLRGAVTRLHDDLGALAHHIEKQARARSRLKCDPGLGRNLYGGYGRTDEFASTAFYYALTPYSTDYIARDDLTLWFGGHPIGRLSSREQLEDLREVHIALVNTLRRSKSLKATDASHKALEDALLPVKARVEEAALRGSFKGRCPACPDSIISEGSSKAVSLHRPE